MCGARHYIERQSPTDPFCDCAAEKLSKLSENCQTGTRIRTTYFRDRLSQPN